MKSPSSIRNVASILIALTCVESNSNAHSTDGWQPLNFVGFEAPFGFAADDIYTEVWGSGKFAYLGSNELGVAIIDISKPRLPEHKMTYGAAAKLGSGDVRVYNNIGYFASDRGGGIEVVDLQNPLEPNRISRIDESIGGFASVSEVAIYRDYLFQVNESTSQVKVFDIRNVETPVFFRELETSDAIGLADVNVFDHHLYVAGLGGTGGEGASYVFDIENIQSADPVLLSTVPTGNQTASIWPFRNEQRLIATHRKLGGNIQVWDTEEFDAPKLITTANASDFEINSFSTGEVAVLDSVAYVAWYEAGIQVVDLDNLDVDASLQRIGVFGTSPDSSPLDGLVGNRSVYPFLGHDQVLVSDTTWGLYIVDATNVLPILGDFDGNRQIEADDLDLLSVHVRDGTHTGQFDLTDDDLVDEEDRRFWITEIANSTYGDSNLDGAFDSTDLVVVFIAGEYEDEFGMNSVWETGDWNGDGDFSTTDLIVAFQAGKYELDNVVSVPESNLPPIGLIWMSVITLWLFRNRDLGYGFLRVLAA